MFFLLSKCIDATRMHAHLSHNAERFPSLAIDKFHIRVPYICVNTEKYSISIVNWIAMTTASRPLDCHDNSHINVKFVVKWLIIGVYS